MDITVFLANPSAWGIGLAVIFGVVWLASLAPLKWRSLFSLPLAAYKMRPMIIE